VGLYLNSALEYFVREDLSRMFTFIVCIFVEIVQEFSKKIIVGCVYRAPGTGISLFNNKIGIILDIINTHSKKISFLCWRFQY